MGVEIVTEKKGVKIFGKRFIPTYRVAGVVMERLFDFKLGSSSCHCYWDKTSQ